MRLSSTSSSVVKSSATFQGAYTSYNQVAAFTEAFNWLPNDRQVGLLPLPDAQAPEKANPAFRPVQWHVLSGTDLTQAQQTHPNDLVLLSKPYPETTLPTVTSPVPFYTMA